MNGFNCLAACLYLDSAVNLETALKLGPYSGLFGIEKSSLDTYLKWYKVLRLHAILHDVSGSIAEQSERSCLFIRFTLSNYKRLHWSPDWSEVCLFVKTFCWYVEVVVLNLEGFRHKKNVFIENSQFVLTTVLTQSHSFHQFATTHCVITRKSHQWVRNFIHGLS